MLEGLSFGPQSPRLYTFTVSWKYYSFGRVIPETYLFMAPTLITGLRLYWMPFESPRHNK